MLPLMVRLLGGVLVWRSFLLASLLSPGLVGSGAGVMVLVDCGGAGGGAGFFRDFSPFPAGGAGSPLVFIEGLCGDGVGDGEGEDEKDRDLDLLPENELCLEDRLE